MLLISPHADSGTPTTPKNQSKRREYLKSLQEKLVELEQKVSDAENDHDDSVAAWVDKKIDAATSDE